MVINILSDKSAQLNTAYGGHLCPSNHVGAESPDCNALSICFAEEHKLVATMPQTLPRPSGRGTKRTPESDRALAHQVQGLKPQDRSPILIHELKLVVMMPKTLPGTYGCERIVAGNRHK